MTVTMVIRRNLDVAIASLHGGLNTNKSKMQGSDSVRRSITSSNSDNIIELSRLRRSMKLWCRYVKSINRRSNNLDFSVKRMTFNTRRRKSNKKKNMKRNWPNKIRKWQV